MWTERVGPTAALATINKHQETNAGSHLIEIGNQVQIGWRSNAEKHGLNIDVSGITPLSHFSFKEENYLTMKALFVQLMLEKGFLASTLFYAMYAHRRTHVDLYLQAVDAVFDDIADAREKRIIEKLLIGKPSSAGFSRLT